YLVTLTGAGGGLVGLGGAVSVTVIASNTTANIGAGAQITTAQSVAVNAVNKAHVFAFAGGAAIGGIAGIGGGIDVGVLLNNTTARIDPAAEVHASGDVSVNALAIKNVQSIGISGGAGLVGLAGSVSLW